MVFLSIPIIAHGTKTSWDTYANETTYTVPAIWCYYIDAVIVACFGNLCVYPW